jgi:Uma2 family endonuclease
VNIFRISSLFQDEFSFGNFPIDVHFPRFTNTLYHDDYHSEPHRMSARTLPRRSTPTLRFGPTDHGRAVTPREIDTAEYTLGFNYEIIDGRLYVSPVPNPPENMLENWLFEELLLYKRSRPDVINYVTPKGRVILPDTDRLTAPEPDITAYANYPLGVPLADVKWIDTEPVLVCEILVASNLDKDLVRNPVLYLRVPSIREYWIVNGVENPDEPSLIQYVRHGKKWRITTHAFGSTFTPKLLPGFSLVIDPRRR